MDFDDRLDWMILASMNLWTILSSLMFVLLNLIANQHCCLHLNETMTLDSMLDVSIVEFDDSYWMLIYLIFHHLKQNDIHFLFLLLILNLINKFD